MYVKDFLSLPFLSFKEQDDWQYNYTHFARLKGITQCGISTRLGAQDWNVGLWLENGKLVNGEGWKDVSGDSGNQVNNRVHVG